MKINIRNREMRIWIDKDDIVNWQGKNLKPSEIIMLGAVLTEHGLNMMGTQQDNTKFKKASNKGN